MKRYLLACSASAFLGAVLATWLQQDLPRRIAVGQEPRPRLQTTLIDDTDADSRLRRTQQATVVDSVSDLSPEELTNISVYEAVNRSVVNITTRSSSPDMLRLFEVPSEGAGSGSVLDRQGHILTNDHVIEGAREILVTLYNGESYPAGLVGRDAANDIAVLRIEAPANLLFPVRFGDSSVLRVGQKVYAIGNPFGLERTMTQGILSSVNRTLASRTGREMKSILQIDAALNRGNSGGPLLDSRGHVIGMNTAIASPSGAGENTGIGFAIPVNAIGRVVPELIEHGRVIRAVIGIAHVYETERGLVVIDVSSGGPADRAGLRGFQMVRERDRRGAFIYEKKDG